MTTFKTSDGPLSLTDIFKNENPDELRLSLPFPDMDKALREKYDGRSYYQRYSKEYFQNRYDRLFTRLRSGALKLRVYGDSERLERYCDALQTILNATTSLRKEYYVTFAVIVEGGVNNGLSMMHTLSTPLDIECLTEAVSTGGVSADELCRRLGLEKKSYGWNLHSQYSSLYDCNKLQQFLNNSEIVKSPPGIGGKSKDRYGSYCFLVPEWRALEFVLLKKYFDGQQVRLISESEAKQLAGWSVSMSQTLSNALAIKGLLLGKILVRGKNKVAVSVVRKVSRNIELPQLPRFGEYDNADGPAMLTILASLIKPGTLTASTTPEDFLRQMYSVFTSMPPELFCMLVSESVMKLGSNPLNSFVRHALLMVRTVEALFKARISPEEDWVSMEFVYDEFRLTLSRMCEAYGNVTDFDSRVLDVTGKERVLLNAADIKTRLFDVTFHGILLVYAALGALELKTDANGTVAALRLTPLGRWYVDPERPFPLEYSAEDINDVFDIDDELMIISARNPDSPMIAMLAEYARPIGATRFRLTRKALMDGCSGSKELAERIDTLKRTVIPNPGPVVKAFFKDTLARFNSVTPTPGGTCYKLFDIDPENKELRDIIMSDPDIRKNSLRVEGCRLLVKTNFLPTFHARLRAAGFPLDSM